MAAAFSHSPGTLIFLFLITGCAEILVFIMVITRDNCIVGLQVPGTEGSDGEPAHLFHQRQSQYTHETSNFYYTLQTPHRTTHKSPGSTYTQSMVDHIISHKETYDWSRMYLPISFLINPHKLRWKILSSRHNTAVCTTHLLLFVFSPWQHPHHHHQPTPQPHYHHQGVRAGFQQDRMMRSAWEVSPRSERLTRAAACVTVQTAVMTQLTIVGVTDNPDWHTQPWKIPYHRLCYSWCSFFLIVKTAWLFCWHYFSSCATYYSVAIHSHKGNATNISSM